MLSEGENSWLFSGDVYLGEFFDGLPHGMGERSFHYPSKKGSGSGWDPLKVRNVIPLDRSISTITSLTIIFACFEHTYTYALIV